MLNLREPDRQVVNRVAYPGMRMQMATLAEMTRIPSAAAPCDQARPGRISSPGSIALKLCVGIIMLALVLLPECVAAREQTAYPRPASGQVSAPPDAPAQSAAEAQGSGIHQGAYFGRERASREAHRIADWIVDSADNQNLPFVVVDKIDAKIFVFDAGGRIQGAGPALLGLARGDHTVPGIGDREYSDMRPEDRTTPAGRFVAALGWNFRGEDVVWVDYDAAISLHRVVTTKPEERRLERLATPTPLDNRISFGCINVPARFYEAVISPAFTGTKGIVYVLPEIRSAREVFGSYDVAERLRPNYADRTEATR
jgi:hypothetical protein